MDNRNLLCLSEFSDRHCLECIFGGNAAFISSEGDTDCVVLNDDCGKAFYSLVFIKEGQTNYIYHGKERVLKASDLIVVPPYTDIIGVSHTPYATFVGLLLDPSFTATVHDISSPNGEPLIISSFNSDIRIFHLDDSKAGDMESLFRQVEKAITQPHLFKNEMIRSLIGVCLMFIEGLGQDYDTETHDFRHKKDIFMIFMHLASAHFRQERQLKFYADKLNITTTYLSRTVKEISGSTVFEHLSCLVFNEACKLLRNGTKSVGEISYELGFNDQSAFTSYFKSRAGKTPVAYRNEMKGK